MKSWSTTTLKIAFRNLVKNPEINLINIFGLSLGLSCFIVIFVHVNRELTYDRYHQQSDNIYKLNISEHIDGGTENNLAIAPGGWSSELRHSLPELERSARIYKCRVDAIVDHEGEKFYEKNFLFADHELLDIFTFEFVTGTPAFALKERKSVIISKEASSKYFGNDDPVGKIIKYTDTEGQTELTVTGVFKNLPSNVHFAADFIGNLDALENTLMADDSPLMKSMHQPLFHTYFLIGDNTAIPALTISINKFISALQKSDVKYSATLQPLKYVHFQKNIGWESGSQTSVYLFLSIGILILAVACINFMSLASAQAEKKLKATGIRKILGTSTLDLMVVSWTEALISSAISTVISVTLIELSLPSINEYLHQDYHIVYFGQGSHLIYIVGITALVGFIAGCYPAFSLSSSNPLEVLKGKISVSKGSLILRRGLVIFQFGVSVFLIISTVFIKKQMYFLQNQDIGVDRAFVVNIPTRGEEAGNNFEAYKTAITAHAGVIDACGSFHRPFEKVWGNIKFESNADVANRNFVANEFNATEGFVETFGIELTAGRTFTRADTGSFLLNETAVKELGLTNETVLGVRIEDKDIFNAPGKVVGVIKDFHYQSLHERIGPLAVWYMPYWPNFMSVKIKPENAAETIRFLKDKWKETNPDTPFAYSFLDDDLNNLYESEARTDSIFTVFAVLAIFIAGLGLFGLSKFSIKKRLKEISIRKTLGGELKDLVYIMTKEYLALVILSILIFSPITYFLISNWLSIFAYHINLNLWVFLFAGIGLLLLCLITVSYQVLKTARTNPADVIRYE